ncbi:MAG: hypothetical protein ABIG32_02435 [Candidatus Uhrbacteria bacterium]|nr:hypothetical protein [Patescibacteria group bacterium]MBU1907466.1 hypothetical protein [Patescibacteria group bacterium]
MADAPKKTLEVAEVKAPELVEVAPAEVEKPKEVPEAKPEVPKEVVEEPKEAPGVTLPPTKVADELPTAPAKDKITEEVEAVLAEDLDELYVKLPPEKQQEFKVKGEEVARDIRTMISEGKVKAKKVVQWIKDWLKMIPGVNKFFLEQEAKIKTDKVLILAEEETKRQEEEI